MSEKDFEVYECWLGQEQKACEITIKCGCGHTITANYDVFDDEWIECYWCEAKYKVIWHGIEVVKLRLCAFNGSRRLPSCQTMFVPKVKNQDYCSPKCYDRARRSRRYDVELGLTEEE